MIYKLRSVIGKFMPFRAAYLQFVRSIKYKVTFAEYLKYRLGFQKLYWPKDRTCLVANSRKIYVGKNSFVGRPCSYLQGAGGLYIGDYVRFGPNVGILSANHGLYEHFVYDTKPVRIGDYSWIGMGAKVLAGVELGPRTIVGANSVVTKSFLEGYCVLAGCPAKVVKYLDKEKFKPWHAEHEFYGFIPAEKFEKKRHKYIDV
jgi:acetyltransferase-like isoleucine patch superfamily enzyme